MGKSLTFRGTVFEASELMKTHRCKDPICDTHLWKVKHELDMAKIRVKKLEAELRKRGIAPLSAVEGKEDAGGSGKRGGARFVLGFVLDFISLSL